MPLLKVKDFPSADAPNCEGWAKREFLFENFVAITRRRADSESPRRRCVAEARFEFSDVTP
jgi:hypothetical protein